MEEHELWGELFMKEKYPNLSIWDMQKWTSYAGDPLISPLSSVPDTSCYDQD